MFSEAQGDEIWYPVNDGSFIPTTVIDGVGQPKVESFWTNDNRKKMLYDKKKKNNCISLRKGRILLSV